MTEKKPSLGERLSAYDRAHPEELERQRRLQEKAKYWTKRGLKKSISVGKALAVHFDETFRDGIRKANRQGHEGRALAAADDYVEAQLMRKGYSDSEARRLVHSPENQRVIKAYVEMPEGASVTINEEERT
jgi:hypothetical protein